ncbi:hypothetical protein B0H16DRAFT_869997 [Mycena metata]|uniref:Myb/SANT-like domain-containing protein n=1 Tax=Mycena metata TaxID=1033252 RepID=A0AAD7IU22_9AGAR|nr:hypothetical protein B0H16DRAFT_1805316 [Mycena metata]KAJ7749723.1 hypothetical protein B0H16DRAFT_869997 [Mycena metata]
MGRSANTPSCDWVTDPDDKSALVGFFHSIKHRIGEGGSWDATCLQEAEAFMAARGPPQKGAPKTVASIRGVWASMKKLHESLLLVIQKRFPGASGWTYDADRGFSVDDENRDAWKAFVKAHSIFKPFANQGWDLFNTVHDVIPSRAKGMNVHNPVFPPTSTHPAIGAAHLQPDLQGSLSPTQINLHLDDDDFPDPSQLTGFSSQSSPSQPFSDWSQSNYGSQAGFGDFDNGGLGLNFGLPSNLPIAPLASSPIVQGSSAPALGPPPASSSVSATPSIAQRSVLATPSVGVKRSAPEDAQTSWSAAKRGKTSGPDAILSLGKSVDNIGSALRDCFMPKESSAVSPTKQVSKARQIAENDMEAGSITDEERAILSLIFGGDSKTADAYVAEKSEAGRKTLTKILISRF